MSREVRNQTFKYLPQVFGHAGEAGLSIEVQDIPTVFDARDAVYRGATHRLFRRANNLAAGGVQDVTMDLWNYQSWNQIFDEAGGDLSTTGQLERDEDALVVGVYMIADIGNRIVDATLLLEWGRAQANGPMLTLAKWGAGASANAGYPPIANVQIPKLIKYGSQSHIHFTIEGSAAVATDVYLEVISAPQGTLGFSL